MSHICDKKLTIKKRFKVTFRRELYIINVLKINLLINNDIINAKNIFIDSTKRIVKIDNCKIIVLIEIKTFYDIAMQKSIHFRKVIIISSRFEQTIKIYYLAMFVNCDYFFEFAKLNYLMIYTYIINVTTKIVIIRNEIDITIYISRNYRLNKVIELKLSNRYQIKDFKLKNLTIRKLEFEY